MFVRDTLQGEPFTTSKCACPLSAGFDFWKRCLSASDWQISEHHEMHHASASDQFVRCDAGGHVSSLHSCSLSSQWIIVVRRKQQFGELQVKVKKSRSNLIWIWLKWMFLDAEVAFNFCINSISVLGRLKLLFAFKCCWKAGYMWPALTLYSFAFLLSSVGLCELESLRGADVIVVILRRRVWVGAHRGVEGAVIFITWWSDNSKDQTLLWILLFCISCTATFT